MTSLRRLTTVAGKLARSANGLAANTPRLALETLNQQYRRRVADA
jgi:hypothetical protein